MTFDAALRRLKLSNAEFAAECAAHRTQVWAWRVGRYVPDVTSALRIIGALRKRGVTIELHDLIVPKKRRGSKSATAA